jgi:hypothetical protein
VSFIGWKWGGVDANWQGICPKIKYRVIGMMTNHIYLYLEEGGSLHRIVGKCEISAYGLILLLANIAGAY